jgi:hypothetical protein
MTDQKLPSTLDGGLPLHTKHDMKVNGSSIASQAEINWRACRRWVQALGVTYRIRGKTEGKVSATNPLSRGWNLIYRLHIFPRELVVLVGTFVV